MSKGYWIGRIDVDDIEIYKTYVAANAAPFAQYGARFLVRGGQFETPEGTSRSRNVVIEFPSIQAATDCYNSAEYAEARAVRQSISTGELIIVEGYDG